MSEMTEQQEVHDEAMNESLVEYLTDYISEEIFANAVGRGREGLKKEHITGILDGPLSLKMRSGVNDTILRGKLNEARDQGFIELDDEFNEIAERASSNGNIFVQFSVTESGKEQIVPAVKQTICERVDAIKELVNNIDQDDEEEPSESDENAA